MAGKSKGKTKKAKSVKHSTTSAGVSKKPVPSRATKNKSSTAMSTSQVKEESGTRPNEPSKQAPLTTSDSPIENPSNFQQDVYILTETCQPESRGETWNEVHAIFTTLELANQAAKDRAAVIENRRPDENWLTRTRKDGRLVITSDWLDTEINVKKLEVRNKWAKKDVTELRKPLYLEEESEQE